MYLSISKSNTTVGFTQTGQSNYNFNKNNKIKNDSKFCFQILLIIQKITE